jgi:hypothetical protein
MLLNYAGHCEVSFAGSLLNEGLSICFVRLLMLNMSTGIEQGEDEKTKGRMKHITYLLAFLA